MANFFSPVSGFPIMMEVPVTPYTILKPHKYGIDNGEDVIYASQPPLLNKAYDMDGQRVSLYHPGTASVTLPNRTARCWNGDRDELGLWEDKTYRQECFGGIRDGKPCSTAGDCTNGVCGKVWPIRMCTHGKTCQNGNGAAQNAQPRRCTVDADCGVGATAKCLAPPHALGKVLPAHLLGLNCSTDDECEAEVDGVRALGRCSATWSLCRQMFDMDRVSANDANRAGFLFKLDYDWIDASSSYLGPGGTRKVQSDLGSKDPKPFATYGWAATGGSNEAHSVWMQHVLGIADLPFLDVDNPLALSPGMSRDVVADHIQAAPSLVDAQRVLSYENKLATAATASTMSQFIFSTFPCFSGSANAPPEFYTSTLSSSAKRLTHTDVECRRDRACYIDLHIIDYVMKADGTRERLTSSISTDRVAIEMALGTPESSQGQLFVAATQSKCEGIGKLSCRFRLENEFWIKRQGIFSKEAVGRIFVKCFVAVDKHDETTCNGNSKTKCTCRSLPMCVKIKMVGSPPAFVAPTPLAENSRDDRGVLVPGRTDVAACEGYKMSLPLVARDADEGDGVRIFVQDFDVYGSSTDKYRMSGGVYNADFFASQSLLLPTQCGKFNGYNASKVGDNARQPDISSLRNQWESAATGRDYVIKSVNGEYAEEIEYRERPQLNVEYMLTRKEGNGLDVTSAMQACTRAGAGGVLQCREKTANMHQVICAYAYDDSRQFAGRWVGKSDPNGDDIQVWQRDHSNGDQVSKQHCWRILLQSPPSFITDPDGEATPFDKEWIQTTTVYTPTSEDQVLVEAAFKRVPMAVSQFRRIKFVAQDPQGEDSVTILLLEDPGIVNNLNTGRSLCVQRSVTEGPGGMCMASDVIDPNRYPDQPWTSPLNAAAESQCSRAERVIEYTALASDAGKQYRVCMAARDDSDACAGVAPTASLRGWYGETQCIIFDVLRPVIQWHADTAALFAQETEAVVGCTTQLTMTAVDVSKSAVTLNSTGNYHLMLFPEPSVPLPAEMSRHVFAALASPSACSSLGVHPYHACACAHACKSAVIESERVCVCVCVQKVCVRARVQES